MVAFTVCVLLALSVGWSVFHARRHLAIAWTESGPVYIDAYGDSTMEGLTILGGAYTMTPHNQPMELQSRLRRQFGDQVTVCNQGVSGTTLGQLIAGDGRHAMGLDQLMSRSGVHIVVANFGINESVADTLGQYMTNVDHFVAEAIKNGKIPVLEEPNPVCLPAPAPKEIAELDAEVAALRLYAAHNNVLLVRQYDYVKSLPNWQSMLVDCVHPTEELYQIEAERLTTALAPIVQSLLSPSAHLRRYLKSMVLGKRQSANCR